MTKETLKSSFDRPSKRGSNTYSTPILRRKIGESPDAFFQRLNAEGYENGHLEKVSAHWNGDHSQYHFGKVESCRICQRQVSVKNDGGPVIYTPIKVGKHRPGTGDTVVVPVYVSASFATQLAAAPTASIRIQIIPSSAKAPKIEKPVVAPQPSSPAKSEPATSATSTPAKEPLKQDVASETKPISAPSAPKVEAVTPVAPLTSAEVAKAKKLDVVVSTPENTREDIKDHERILAPPGEKAIGGNTKVTKTEVLAAYPEKVPINGGHGDVNRVLEAAGKEPIYQEEDELKHKKSDGKRLKKDKKAKK